MLAEKAMAKTTPTMIVFLFLLPEKKNQIKEERRIVIIFASDNPF